MPTAKPRTTASPKKNVQVFVGDDACGEQPNTFNLCPLGLQFYSPRKITDFSLLELNLKLEGSKTPVNCTGAVVRCQKETGQKRYRVWVQFLDLPDGKREKIRCASRAGKHLCCFCENF